MFISFANFIFPLLDLFFPPNVPRRPILSQTLTFQLRHFHAVTPSAHVYFADAPSRSTFNADIQPLSISTAPVRTARPLSAETRALSMRAQPAALDWEDHEIPGPDVSKRETLLLLAKMTSNAYHEPDTDAWYNLTDEWGIVRSLVSPAFDLQLTLDTTDVVCSTRQSGGSLTMTASVDTFSLQTTTTPSCFPSKARPRWWLTAGQPQRKIS